ncbi:MAG TPA: hypothetical protein VHR86_06145 [Armatimonadota bacterium]|nr:hypothetical protein [Armatimonadota bacterium]
MASSVKTAGQLELCLRVGGQRALTIVETGSHLRSIRLAEHLRAAGWEPRPIVVGLVAVYAVRDSGEGVASLENLETDLKNRYRLAICEPGFSDSLYRVAQELAETAEGEFTPVEKCVVCGELDPFPTILSAVNAEGETVSAPYCARCVAANESNTYGRLCRALLTAGGSGFGALQNAQLGRALRKGAVLRVAVHPDDLATTP